MTALAPHQQRVVDEKAALDEKIVFLTQFITDNPVFGGLPLDERGRLKRQRLVMIEYSDILGERISEF